MFRGRSGIALIGKDREGNQLFNGGQSVVIEDHRLARLIALKEALIKATTMDFCRMVVLTNSRESNVVLVDCKKLGVRLVHVFKHMFSVCKQYYTYFHIFFHTHVYSKNTNNVIRTMLPNGP